MTTIDSPSTGNGPFHASDADLARLMGALFVVTMLMGMVDAYLAAPILRGPLNGIAADRSAVLLGGLMRLFMAIGVVGIAIAFFPVARRFSETAAVSYLGLRIAECVLLALGSCSHVYLIDLSRSSALAGGADAIFFSTQHAAALGFGNATYQMAMTILGFSGMIQCRLLFATRLVPRWISTLGLLGYFLLLLSAILGFLGVVDTSTGTGAILYVPGGVFELVVFPSWLFCKGFRAGGKP